jgi:TPR repeat protein
MNAHRLLLGLSIAAVAHVAVFITTPVLAAASDAKPKWVGEFEKGCEKGQMQDCVNLALAYSRGAHNGKKIEKDPKLARHFGERALQTGSTSCRQGNLKNCYMVGLLYFEGEFINSDFEKGLDYTRKACVGGYKEACEWLKNSGVQ